VHNHTSTGIAVGGVFAAAITWIAMSQTIDVGGFALLASVVFGLTAGLCIGGLIAANFALLDMEEREHAQAHHATRMETHAHAHAQA